MNITPYDLAMRYVGVKEFTGDKHHPLVQWWLSLCGFSIDTPDEVPWCSAFANGIAWELRLPRSKSAAARSWLNIGTPIELEQAKAGFDVVVLQRGDGIQPGPEIVNAPGHVGFFSGVDKSYVLVLGGNQGNAVNIQRYPVARVLGLRRLGEP